MTTALKEQMTCANCEVHDDSKGTAGKTVCRLLPTPKTVKRDHWCMSGVWFFPHSRGFIGEGNGRFLKRWEGVD